MRVLFNADFFKNAPVCQSQKPAELVVGTARLAGGITSPTSMTSRWRWRPAIWATIAGPTSVEGWHTGSEWINSATLMSRVNFASRQLADVNKPGVRAIIQRVRAQGTRLAPGIVVDICLDVMGRSASMAHTTATARPPGGHRRHTISRRIVTRPAPRSGFANCCS